MAQLEDGASAVAFASGHGGDHGRVPGPRPGRPRGRAPRRLLRDGQAAAASTSCRWGLEVSFADMTDLAAVRAALRPSHPARLDGDAVQSDHRHHRPARGRGDRPRSAGALDRLRQHVGDAVPAAAAGPRHRPRDALHDEVPLRPLRRDGRRRDHARGGPLGERLRVVQIARGRRAFALRLLARAAGHSHPALAHARALRERAGGGRSSCPRIPAWSASTIPGLPRDPGHALASTQMAAAGGMLSFVVPGRARRAPSRWRRGCASSPAPRAWAARRASSSTAPPSKASGRAPRRASSGSPSGSSTRTTSWPTWPRRCA